MNKLSLISFLEDSFIRPLLINLSITDISYNGKHIFYQDNVTGRNKSDISITNDEAYNFIRQIANLSEKQFSFSTPYLDVSFGRYRISAVHHSIAKYEENGIITFSIRITSNKNRVNEDYGFIDKDLRELLSIFLQHSVSIVISGLPSSGKTELQKYLISLFKKNTRVIVIDNINELSLISNEQIDLSLWNYREDISSLDTLIKQALRSDPDWLIIAESRGKEMASLLTSSMTGVPLITTIHSLDNNGAPNRIARMIMQNKDSISYEQILSDVYYYFSCYIHVKKETSKDNKIIRYIDEISLCDDKGKFHTIFKSNYLKKEYKELSDEFIKKYGIDKKILIKTKFFKK